MNSSSDAVIIIDTREQEPYTFDYLSPTAPVPTIRQALPAGDYSLEGFETTIAVERKSLDDFVHTVIRGQRRFTAELKKLQAYQSACIVVEASLRDIVEGNYSSKTNPFAIMGKVVSLDVDWGIPVFCCSDRQVACRFTYGWLMRWWRKLQKEKPGGSP